MAMTNEEEVNALPQADKVRMARLVLNGWRFTRKPREMWTCYNGGAWRGSRLTLCAILDRAEQMQAIYDEVSTC